MRVFRKTGFTFLLPLTNALELYKLILYCCALLFFATHKKSITHSSGQDSLTDWLTTFISKTRSQLHQHLFQAPLHKYQKMLTKMNRIPYYFVHMEKQNTYGACLRMIKKVLEQLTIFWHPFLVSYLLLSKLLVTNYLSHNNDNNMEDNPIHI